MAYDKVVDSAKLEAGLTRIADAIRNHVEDPGPPRACQFPEDFVTGVADAYAAGRSVGQAEGSSAGYEVGYSEGKQSEYDRFWDAAQENGTKTTYSCAFAGYCWNDETYNPKYPITATANATYMFWNSRITNTKVPIHHPIGGTNNTNIFNGCNNLVTIPLLVVVETSAFSASTWTGCTKLENLTIEGVIGNNLPISSCTKLSHDSLMSIIEHLKDYAGSGTTHTVTLGTTNLNKLTAAEKKIATDKGWTLA